MPPHHGRAVRSHRRPPHQWRSRNLRLSLLLAASLVFWAPSGPAAREIATREPAARSGRSRGPPWPCRYPPAPSGALHTGGAWSLMCGSVRRLEARPGLVAHGHSSLAPPPPTGTEAVPSGTLHSRLLSLTGAAGDSRETVIAFAGVCSVSGETDDTIAGQIHLVLLLFHRAKASWVSWRRPEVPALVLTVSSRGAVSSMGATKFAQRRLSLAIARKYSPSVGKMAQNGRFMACWASFFAEMAHMTSRWASFLCPPAP